MKIIYLVRHAKSSWDNAALKDFDRPLNDRGMRDAPRMGQRLKERNISPDLMVSSPANRALATCREIATQLGYEPERIKTDPHLYHASDDELFNIVRSFDNKHNEIIVFGHNPGFTLFANALLNERIMNIPTCGVVAGELNIQDWYETKAGCGKLLFFDFPKKYKRK